MKLKPSAILFDLDGVLVDSFDAWLAALNEALERFHYSTITRGQFIDKYWGHDLFDNIEKMSIPIEVGDYCNNAYGNHIERVRIYHETINVLQKLRNYKKAVITNTPKDSTFSILRKFDIKKYFDVVITSNDVSMAKPNPEIVIKACEHLGINPKDAVLIGDTDSDVKAGKAAGCKVIGVNVDADYTIKNISELVTLIVL